MAQVIISIAASGDDVRVRRTGSTYPPTSDGGVDITNTDLEPAKQLVAGPIYRTLDILVRFNTSIIPITATVTSAVLRLRNSGAIANADSRDFNFEWYSGNTWANTGVATVAADYVDVVGTTAAVLPFASLLLGVDNDIALSNPNENIVKTGYTGIRFGLSGGAPSGDNDFFFRAWDHATEPEPKLIVNFIYPFPPATKAFRVGRW